MTFNSIIYVFAVILVFVSQAESDVSTKRFKSNESANRVKTIDEERTGELSADLAHTYFTKMYSAKTVFKKAIGRDISVYWLFQHKNFAPWVTYAENFKETSYIPVLLELDGSEKLIHALLIAKNIPEYKELATKVSTELMRYWLEIGKNPEEIFRADKSIHRGAFFEEPSFVEWAQYVQDFNQKYTRNIRMAPLLNERNIDDKTILEQAESQIAKHDKETQEIAIKLTEEVSDKWVISHKTPAQALAEIGSKNLLSKPFFYDFWVKYLKAFNQNSEHVTVRTSEAMVQCFKPDRMVKILQNVKANSAGTTFIEVIQSSLIDIWLKNDKSVLDIFDVLGLRTEDPTGDATFKLWMSYMDKSVIKNGNAGMLLQNLETRFKGTALFQILNVARTYSSMQHYADMLLIQKAESIFNSNRSPFKVLTLIGLDNIADTLLSNPLFKIWVEYTERFNKKNPTTSESVDSLLIRAYGYTTFNKMMHNTKMLNE